MTWRLERNPLIHPRRRTVPRAADRKLVKEISVERESRFVELRNDLFGTWGERVDKVVMVVEQRAQVVGPMQVPEHHVPREDPEVDGSS